MIECFLLSFTIELMIIFRLFYILCLICLGVRLYPCVPVSWVRSSDRMRVPVS